MGDLIFIDKYRKGKNVKEGDKSLSIDDRLSKIRASIDRIDKLLTKESRKGKECKQ